ncbi:PREDICTED: 2-succinylbenzoate--CoA ligase, chloroplastic/peroxisomal isoform X2 [Tarenaya hassleriana]|uniref:2-succinylbenzoate--CoA ligase, chloroplastic/peroxisomal isoform X2 n=1 Tax=Tarenaya hassleriana TaxID=28532 RepID=UPI00053C1152|nr:PREDICTED: 2-succinylbenzoate--CoA ligase, chloroplastic/peroxisomal isoform X2 [Tarenaya hassleriana]XP_010540648.1 PREDICTED: 2-succinylbenzoate--CoA ligase, chloroplastic/peroxisomal isoform X2 [Tarenaya hassleriana]
MVTGCCVHRRNSCSFELQMGQSLKEAQTGMLMVEPVLLVTDENCSSWIRSVDAPSLKWRVLMDSASKSFANDRDILTSEMLKQHYMLLPSPSMYRWAPGEAVVICFTSGTTGKPKGVTISHLAIITQSLAKVAMVGYSEDDVYLHTAPLVHIGGLSSAMAMLMVGACHVLLPKFDAETALKATGQHLVTCFITVPTMMSDLVSMNRAKGCRIQKASVRKILNGGGSLSNELLIDAIKIFPKAKILSAYGMTETCSSLTFMTLYDPKPESNSSILRAEKFISIHRPQGICVGKPAPHVELKIHLENSSSTGKILTRGPHVMLGYWGKVQVNIAGSESSNGAWLETGDIGEIDEFGNLWLIGRSNGRIKSGGENVYPEEVEAVLLQHPGVLSAVVTGVAETRLGEMVVACVCLKEKWQWSEENLDGSDTSGEDLLLSSEILRRYCRTQNLTGFKIPKRFFRWKKHFPVTSTGKVRRDEVRREVASLVQTLNSSL